MNNRTIRIGSRGSKLAIWQANYFKSLVSEKGLEAEINVIKTKGDSIQNIGFDKMEGKGFFTKEIEDALLKEEIDIAVHSMKDLPTAPPAGLVIGGISSRANPQDFLIIKKASQDKTQILKLKPGGMIGTSSVRRKVLIGSFRPDIQFMNIRGNVPTRLQKLREDHRLDAVILAAAGIERLGISLVDFHLVKLNPKEFPCAPAQGVLAYQCREEDLHSRRLLKSLNDYGTLSCTNVERRVLQLMDGGCQIPLGAYCERDSSGNYQCFTAYSSAMGKPVQFINRSQSTTSNLAERIVEDLKSKI